jgi:tetratricopeptide (TPR) repeat protein
MTREPPKIIQLDQIEPVAGPGSLTWRPVRWSLGARAFGCNAPERAREILAEGLEAHPDSGSPYYNLGCLEAVQGRRDAALDALRRALELRPQLAEWASDDEDFASLHDDPEFRSLVERSNAD